MAFTFAAQHLAKLALTGIDNIQARMNICMQSGTVFAETAKRPEWETEWKENVKDRFVGR